MKPGTTPEVSQRWGVPFLRALCALCGEHSLLFVACVRGDQMPGSHQGIHSVDSIPNLDTLDAEAPPVGNRPRVSVYVR